MYIWKTSSLAEDIKNNSIGQREWKKYYLAVSIFMTLAMYLTALSPREDLVSVLVEAVAMVGILIFGVSITYTSNNGDSGIDYISRMTALTFPILVKLFLLSLLFGVLVGILSEALSLPESAMEWIMVGFVSIIQIGFFWRINTHIKYINA
ncbi:hypothetical protein [Marinobacter salarius]|jgi:hypothetical protein|uniref:hypothetical protein n=1 Tax=Marinobacter salarius TaxID=1420917 RepID=UPI0018F1E5E2|nr:hypothetical protein [Marinobacter salarius]MBJ7298871.1 hypothetical protein [Marinobacter salarius]MDP4530711.1 hypothetical protein [Marinobacter salarius]HIO31633.1 hypothetical protein [Marinobacter salarius]HIO99992.1 hypothetical protein [Marinobacter salarius]